MPETTDKNREEARKLYRELMYSSGEGEDIQILTRYIEQLRSEAKAEALREAAERVEKYMDGNHPPHHYSVGVHNALMGCTAILADKPNKEE